MQDGKEARAVPERGARLTHLDRARVFLTLLVVAHHAAITYGAEGSWPYREGATDGLSPVVLSLFCGINQSFFMSAFFVLAGYFCPSSLARKGTRAFIADRLLRLGTPIVVYNLVLVVANDWMLSRLPGAAPFDGSLSLRFGPLWFLQALLVASIAYALVARVVPSLGRVAAGEARAEFPNDRVLLAWIAVLALCTYLTRIWLPMGVWAVFIEPAHLVHYVVAFCAGVVAGRHGWLAHVPTDLSRRWARRAVVVLIALPVVGIGLGALTDPSVMSLLMGGPGPAAAFYAVWETILMVALTLLAVAHFERVGESTWVARFTPADAFGAYIVHQTVLLSLAVGMASLPIPSVLKFVLLTSVGAVASFALARASRALPGARRILG